MVVFEPPVVGIVLREVKGRKEKGGGEEESRREGGEERREVGGRRQRKEKGGGEEGGGRRGRREERLTFSGQINFLFCTRVGKDSPCSLVQYIKE
jgi:hypothetical protein